MPRRSAAPGRSRCVHLRLTMESSLLKKTLMFYLGDRGGAPVTAARPNIPGNRLRDGHRGKPVLYLALPVLAGQHLGGGGGDRVEERGAALRFEPGQGLEEAGRPGGEIRNQAHLVLGEREEGEIIAGLSQADDVPDGGLGVLELAREL